MAASKTIKHKVYTRYNGEKAPGSSCRRLIKRAVLAVLQSEEVDMPCVVSVLITDDKGIRKYNRNYRGINKATDVLSFPMQIFMQAGWSGRGDMEPDHDTGRLPLGDIVISMETVNKQAIICGNTVRQETAYLIIHSALHLLGYDHDNKSNEKKMKKRNRLIMRDITRSRCPLLLSAVKVGVQYR